MLSLSLYEDELGLRSAGSFSSESDDFQSDVNLEMDVRDAGSDDSALSATNSGLRRQPVRGDVFEWWGLSWALSLFFSL